ncbi:hypothetical protein CHX87_004845 [Salmonella enterica subsp. enterica serovar Minnesota]|nr:hypothetical protein [Salmonella enterica subsp. enterica serovar Minnesota]
MAQVHVTYKRRRIDSSKPSLVKKQSCKNGGDHRFCFLPHNPATNHLHVMRQKASSAIAIIPHTVAV